MDNIRITATDMRRELRRAFEVAKAGKGRVLITKHNKVICAIVGPEELAKLALPTDTQTLSEEGRSLQEQLVSKINTNNA